MGTKPLYWTRASRSFTADLRAKKIGHTSVYEIEKHSWRAGPGLADILRRLTYKTAGPSFLVTRHRLKRWTTFLGGSGLRLSMDRMLQKVEVIWGVIWNINGSGELCIWWPSPLIHKIWYGSSGQEQWQWHRHAWFCLNIGSFWNAR